MYEILLIVIIIILVIGIHQKSTNAICLSRKRLEGKTVLVTGGTAGMGLEIATDLAHRGARVIVACPFTEEGINAKNQIVQETRNDNVVFKHLDLASLDSVRKFSANILSSEDRMDILINNAGVGVPRDDPTEDGMNFIMQVNYYGAFLLTLLLLPLLKKTGKLNDPSRILLTSSVLHNAGRVDFTNVKHSNMLSRILVYGNSKFYLVLFGHELTKRLKGSNVVVNSVDPGAVGTRIFESGNKLLGLVLSFFINMLFKTTWQGAQTALHAALDEKAGEMSGVFFKNCAPSKGTKRAYCDKTAQVVWDQSMKLVRLEQDELQNCLKAV